MVLFEETKEMIRIFKKIIIFTLLAFAGSLISCASSKPAPARTDSLFSEYRRDSVFQGTRDASFKVADSLRIVHASDTAVLIKPFTGELIRAMPRVRDGRLIYDTLKIYYKLPQNKIDVELKSLPDSLYQIRDTHEYNKITEKYINVEKPWWYALVLAGAGLAAGIIITAGIKR